MMWWGWGSTWVEWERRGRTRFVLIDTGHFPTLLHRNFFFCIAGVVGIQESSFLDRGKKCERIVYLMAFFAIVDAFADWGGLHSVAVLLISNTTYTCIKEARPTRGV